MGLAEDRIHWQC